MLACRNELDTLYILLLLPRRIQDDGRSYCCLTIDKIVERGLIYGVET